MRKKTSWLEDYYLYIKIIAVASGSLTSIAITPLTEFWKGFLLGGVLLSFVWLFFYSKFRQKK